MKLFTKYNRINIITSVVIFLAGSVAFYFALRYVLIRQLDDTLRTERTEIRQFVDEHNELPEIVNTNGQQISIVQTGRLLDKSVYTSEKIWNAGEKESEWTRKIQFTVVAGNKIYEVTVSKSQVETEDLLKLIIFIAVVMIALILLTGYLVNRVILKKLWLPFYNTIAGIRQYGLIKQQPLQLPGTNIEEFSLLNHSVNVMTERVQQEYQVLKNFTGNAAHEMQTPLAVIASHTEALMQDEQVLQHHAVSITTIEQSVNRLSRLNQSLLLLAKIENGRFELNETVHWDVLLKQKTNEWQELIASRGLKLALDIEPVTSVFHQHLADILVSNLLSNSIRYNREAGTIVIKLKGDQLSIANTSLLPALDGDQLFNRFFRHPQTEPDGNGLGLSIAKQVCELGNYKISYRYEQLQHVFAVTFICK